MTDTEEGFIQRLKYYQFVYCYFQWINWAIKPLSIAAAPTLLPRALSGTHVKALACH